MKTFLRILKYIAVSIFSLIGLLLFFLNIRSIFAGDFLLMNSGASSFFSYLFRALYFASMLFLSFAVIAFDIKKKKICIVLLSTNVALIIGALISLFYYHLIVALLVIFVNLLMLAVTLPGYLKKESI